MKMDYVLTERVLEKEMSAKKAFQKGEIIDKRFVKMRPDVARNSDVRVFFVSNGAVMISIDGTAIGSAIVTACNRLKESESKILENQKQI